MNNITTLTLPAVGSLAAAPSTHPHERAPSLAPKRRLSSETLLGGEREIEIEHSGALYRLRLTSLGKLILTK
ncbi:hemin uptake protein HemP [Roseateles sp. BYS180W]|uniref:Hemin uptake protein HemP n=1 Tax=Roseateles rivi TaxID=3299028 RepID=A0ABW7FRQ9_9BURK